MKVIGGAFYTLAGFSIDLREYRTTKGAPVFIAHVLGDQSPKLPTREAANQWVRSRLTRHVYVSQPEQLTLF